MRAKWIQTAPDAWALKDRSRVLAWLAERHDGSCLWQTPDMPAGVWNDAPTKYAAQRRARHYLRQKEADRGTKRI